MTCLLPYVSAKAVLKVKDRLPIPTKCHYCGGEVRLASNKEIYNGTEYGSWPYIYLCDCCKSYVGLHPQTHLPLGTLADGRTRGARKQKLLFLDLVQEHFGGDRAAGYAWLADQMGIPVSQCHWGMFDVEQCNVAAAICARRVEGGGE